LSKSVAKKECAPKTIPHPPLAPHGRGVFVELCSIALSRYAR
jgi:hypothetical protein